MKKKEKQKGSILILTLLSMVVALSISVAMISISIAERKMTTKSKKSVTAFQNANSGLEWALKKINDADFKNDGSGLQTIADIFADTPMDPNTGKISCPSNNFIGDSKSNCEIYLLGGTNQNRQIIKDSSTTMDKIIAIRTTGIYGEAEEKVGRSLEAYAMPNCGNGYTRVADFCVQTDLNAVDNWLGAINTCASGGKRLCTTAELLAADAEGDFNSGDSIGSSEEWTADVTDSSNDFYIDESQQIQSGSSGDSKKFRCCMNR